MREERGCRNVARSEVRQSGIDFARIRTHSYSSIPRGDHMKFWILACGALVAVAAHAAYTFRQRQGKRRAQFTDQVSNEWLATAKIHEDHN